MKILIADKLSPKAVSALEDMGAEVTVNPDLTAEDLPLSIGNANVLIVRSTKVFAETIEAGSGLELIIRAGAGVNTIDLDAASNMGVYVANCPGKNSDAVAELALGLIIAADRHLVDASADLRAGKWKKKHYQKAAGLKGRTLGIIGFGAIGKSLAKRAKGLEMNVIAWSRSLTPDAADGMGITHCDSIFDVARNADAISVHLAVTSDTKQLINRDFFDCMKEGAIFVNTSRGEVVNTKDLTKAIEEKDLHVALDVFENEPSGGDAYFDQTELAGMVACTPHIGASTNQAADAIADEAVRIVESLVKTGHPVNAVNSREKSADGAALVVRHHNRVGVLASVLDELREVGINVEEMENSIFSGGKTAVASLKLDKAPDDKLLARIAKDKSIIQAGLK